MNNIVIYYIDGISRENTPYFSDVQRQAEFFSTKSISQIIDGFYVPHYEDTINLSTDDLNFNTKANYLSLLFNGKMYYYFIDSVEYIDESSVAVRITMDTIQTFMFDINIHESIIERKFIDRWTFSGNNIDINRNYLRENLSLGVWEEPEYNYFSISDVGVIITRFSTTDTGIINDTKFNPVWKFDGQYIYDTGYEHFTFIRTNGLKLTTLVMTPEGGTSSSYGIGNTALQKLRSDCANEEVISIAYIPFIPLKGITVYGQELRVAYDTNVYEQVGTNPSLQMKGIVSGDEDWSNDILPESIWRTLSPHIISYSNKLTSVPYDPKYIPQMQDENYVSVNFGERSYTASYPLHKTTKTFVYPKYAADIRDGRRLYAITDDATDTTFSAGGIIITDSPIYLTRYTDAWTAWQSRNKFTLAAAAASFAVQCVTMGVGGATSVTIAQAAMSKTMGADPGYSDIKYGRYKTPKGYTKYGPRIGRAVSGILSENKRTDSVSRRYYSGYAPNGGNLIYTASGAANAWLSPDSIKQEGTASLDRMASCRNIFYKIKVRDFDRVALHYHKYGYLVRTPFKSVWIPQPPTYQHMELEPFMTTLKSRYYFDYYKFEYADIDLTVLCSDDMLADIEERLVDGIRVWYLDHGPMCDYQYDNVERSSL